MGADSVPAHKRVKIAIGPYSGPPALFIADFVLQTVVAPLQISGLGLKINPTSSSSSYL
jgi:hypothetical protein